MKLIILLVLATLAIGSASPTSGNKGIFDCLTNPCLNVPGVGKLKGTKKVLKFISELIYKNVIFTCPFIL
jgi:hypothetical protein